MEMQHRGKDIRLLPDIYAALGLDTDHAHQDVIAWTRPGAGLGLKKRDFPKVQVRRGGGTKKRYAASKKVWQKMWPRLVRRLSLKRRRQ